MNTQHLVLSAKGTASALAKSISQKTGQLRSQTDLGAYAKLAQGLHINGYEREANLALDYVKDNFLQSDGDFRTSIDLKSNNGAYQIYYPYINQWIIRAAVECNRPDLMQESQLQFVNKYWNTELKGATISTPYDPNNTGENDNSICIFQTAQMGLTSLFTGNISRAIDCGDTIVSFLNDQKESNGIYLRKDRNGNLITNHSPLEYVSKTSSDQLFFFVGLPLWYLSVLYDEFDREKEYEKYVNAAHKIGQFVMDSYANETNILASNWSHKVATGLSILSEVTEDVALSKKYQDMSVHIANNLINNYQQEDGLFDVDPDHSEQENLDQSAEIAMHLKLIYIHLNHQ